MKYYSEILDKVFDTTKDLEKAETLHAEEEAKKKKARTERAKDAKEVEDAFKHANDLLKAFVKKYGSYHQTIDTSENLFDYISKFFLF